MKRPYLFLFAMLFTFVGIIPGFAIAITTITDDHSVLLALKSQLSLDPSHALSISWSNSSSASVCDWIGVTCGSRHQRVTGLDLSYMNLTTTTLPPQIGNLSFLVSLNLSSNNFHGHMPLELTRLRRLRILDFSFNSLDGEIPSWFYIMSELEIVILGNNSFTGLIPPLSNMSNVQVLDFSSNTLYGEIPTEIGNLLNLKTLILSGNQISGSIPSALFNMSTLEILDLTSNILQGTLPDSMCNTVSRLELLGVSMNDLHGEIPTNLSNCSRLQMLALSFNRFSGSIPRGIGRNQELAIYETEPSPEAGCQKSCCCSNSVKQEKRDFPFLEEYFLQLPLRKYLKQLLSDAENCKKLQSTCKLRWKRTSLRIKYEKGLY